MKSQRFLERVSPLYLTERGSEGAQATAAEKEAQDGEQFANTPIEPEEVRQQRVPPTPYMPTLSELQEHRIPHLPYRCWCPDCVEAFAREMAHRATDPALREFSMISVDYFFLSAKGVITRTETEGQWETPPEDTLRVLAGVCSSTKVLFAHAVPQKGDDSNGYAAKCLADSIAWMGHSKVTIRSDNEPAMITLVAAATNILKLGGVDVTVEGSIPYDPQSNGAAESAVRLVKGSLRTLQLGLERESC